MNHPKKDSPNSPSPCSVKSLAAIEMDSSPSSSSPARHRASPPSSLSAAASGASPRSQTERMRQMMDDPEEWAKFRKEMAAGGHVTNAAAAMELLRRARAEEEKAAAWRAEAALAAQEVDDATSGEGAAAQEAKNQHEEEDQHHEQANLVNKGLRWINQTLSATSMAQESSSTQLEWSQRTLRAGRRRTSLTGLGHSDREMMDHSDRSGGIGGGGRIILSDRKLGGGGTAVRKSKSTDAISALCNTNISARAHDDPMLRSGNLTKEQSEDTIRTAQTQLQDSDDYIAGHLSGHLDIHDDDDIEPRNIVSDAAKAVRRGSGSLIEYLSGMAAGGGEENGADDIVVIAGNLAAGGEGCKERVKRRGGRRRRSFDLRSAVQGLENEIDAADYEEGGGH